MIGEEQLCQRKPYLTRNDTDIIDAKKNVWNFHDHPTASIKVNRLHVFSTYQEILEVSISHNLQPSENFFNKLATIDSKMKKKLIKHRH